MGAWHWLVLALALVTCHCALVREPPTLTIPDQGVVAGREVAVGRGRRALLYLGLPFAQPPLQHLRFAPPVTDPLPAWQGVRNASLYAPACMQQRQQLQLHDRLRLVERLFAGDHLFRIDEDCLYLNVFVPDGQPSFQ
ncbi:carboxylesterase 4A-like [Nilaparvata lugens]|uniref:carboxylesterase 4A-like n=1 Tax=Nilaparvata lugens TaxID=108931 RepID=UPI00193C8E64|nr:carboxylesterase 4A-like [Nilaparvata lugens]